MASHRWSAYLVRSECTVPTAYSHHFFIMRSHNFHILISLKNLVPSKYHVCNIENCSNFALWPMGKRPSVVSMLVVDVDDEWWRRNMFDRFGQQYPLLVNNFKSPTSRCHQHLCRRFDPKNFLNRISWYGFSQHVSLGQTKGTKISFEDRFAETIFRKCIYANLDMKHVI